MYPFFVVWIVLKTGIICFYIGNFFDSFNAQHTHVLNMLKSVTYIPRKEKRIDFMSDMKKCTIG